MIRAPLRRLTDRKRRLVALTPEEQREFERERARYSPYHDPAGGGFIRWARDFAYVVDKDAEREAKLELWPGQERIVPLLARGDWLIALKGRQLGITAMIAVWVLWQCCGMRRFYQVIVVNQDLDYAIDFIDKVRWTYDRLPSRWQMPITVDRKTKLAFKIEGPHIREAEIRAVAGSKKAARSFTGDLCIFDEGAYIPNLKDSLKAVIPTLAGSRQRRMGHSKFRSGRGQIVVLTTSDGPLGEFADLWRDTYGEGGQLLDANGYGPNGFRPVFLHWSERPGRDEEFRASEKQRLDAISPVAYKHEYPDTIEEAFEYAEGRIFPLFTRERNVGTVKKIRKTAQRGRAIDWGESKSAFVVLWYYHIPGPPGFLVSPDCPNTVNEFLAYRFDANGDYPTENNHAIDALRYAVTTHNLRGMVYVYREIYEPDSVARGWNPFKDIKRIHEISGWEKAEPGDRRHLYAPGVDAELFDLALVADGSMGKIISEFNYFDIPTIRHKMLTKEDTGKVVTTPGDRPFHHRIMGYRWLAALIDASVDMDKAYHIDRQSQALRIHRQIQREPVKRALTLEERRHVQIAKRLQRGRRKS